MKAAVALLLLLASTAHSAATGHTIVQSYERILEGHLSHLTPEQKLALKQRWLKPGVDPLRLEPADPADVQFPGALDLMRQAAETLDEKERNSLAERLRKKLSAILRQFGSSDRELEVLDKEERKKSTRSVFSVYRHIEQFRRMAVSGDGKWIAVGETKDKTVSVLDFRTQALVRKLEFEAPPASVRFSPDGKYLAVSFAAEAIFGFEIFETGGWKSVLKDLGGAHRAPIFLKGSDRVVEWGQRGNRIFSLNPARMKGRKPVLSSAYYSDQVVAPDGSLFAGYDSGKKHIDIYSDEGKYLYGFQPGVETGHDLVFYEMPGGKTLIRVYGNSVDFHDVASGNLLSRRKLGLDKNHAALGMAVDKQGKHLFVSERDVGVHVYRIEAGASGPKIHRVAVLSAGTDRSPHSLLLTPDDRALLVETYDEIVMFDLEAARALGEI